MAHCPYFPSIFFDTNIKGTTKCIRRKITFDRPYLLVNQFDLIRLLIDRTPFSIYDCNILICNFGCRCRIRDYAFFELSW